MKRRLATIAVALLILPLAACTKPNPGVSVFSGAATEREEAICWAAESDQLEPGACAADTLAAAVEGGRVPRLSITPGNTIGISVDPVVAETGWFPSIGGQRLTEQPVTSTYFRFQFPDLQPIPADGLTLEVIAGSGDKTRGIWVFAIDAA